MPTAAAQLENTTIVAVATPPGRGGVGVVRLSGADTLRIATALFPSSPQPQPRRASYRILRDCSGARIDDALLTWFPAPASYTGEDVLEIATHGSPVVQDWLLRACVRHGATPARPGEFTERAFLNGRLDLTAAEAVRDLIDAQTLGQAQLAAQQLAGSIAQVVHPIKDALLHLVALLEAGIDFAEDDLETVPTAAVHSAMHAIIAPLRALAASFQHGRLLRQGLRIAIVGEPNVGKSSLFNRLLQQERAIVTARPGTTRDVISERVTLDGIPVELLDTAGLRETEDEAERMGIARSRSTLADADAILLVLDGAHNVAAAVPADVAALLAGRPVVRVLNKVDLWIEKASGGLSAHEASRAGHPAASSAASGTVEDGRGHAVNGPAALPTVHTSATTGHGIEELKQAVLHMARGTGEHAAGAATLTNLRQHSATERAVAALERADAAAQSAMPHEMVLLDLYEALHSLDELTGITTPDDVLNLIFSSFCIGK